MHVREHLYVNKSGSSSYSLQMQSRGQKILRNKCMNETFSYMTGALGTQHMEQVIYSGCPTSRDVATRGNTAQAKLPSKIEIGVGIQDDNAVVDCKIVLGERQRIQPHCFQFVLCKSGTKSTEINY
jgi:hypothetical protein